jgi:hypothetical protein
LAEATHDVASMAFKPAQHTPHILRNPRNKVLFNSVGDSGHILNTWHPLLALAKPAEKFQVSWQVA